MELTELNKTLKPASAILSNETGIIHLLSSGDMGWGNVIGSPIKTT